jgi:cell division transport system permease protein
MEWMGITIMKRYRLGYFLAEGVRGIFIHGFMSFAAVVSTVACLLIMGSFTLVAVNLGASLTNLEQQNEVLAYVDETLSDEEAKAVESQLSSIPNVLSCQFVSREQAMQEFVADKEDNSIYQSLPADILRHRYRIRLENIAEMSQTLEQIKATSGIADVNALLEVSHGFLTVRNIVGGVALILIVVLFVISIFIISNTIRLATFARRDEIAIMKMVGATNWFIRWPFIYEGLILGLLGAVIAFFCQWGIYTVLGRAIASSDTMTLFTVLPFQRMALIVGGFFMGTGLLVGVGGSLLTIRKFLKV